jgi:RepB DNA-primase from phage plasmid
MPAHAVDSSSRSTAGAAAAQPALDMLDVFASVGAERFHLLLTDLAGGKVSFRGNRSLAELRSSLPRLLGDAAQKQHNVIIRPRGSGPALIQLDDLDDAALARLRPVSFLTLRTSPGNYQAWVAVAEADADLARRLRKGAGADPSASGATRVSGSSNFKEKYAPAFPRVETVHTSPGLVVTPAGLEALGVVAPPDKAESTPAPARVSQASGRRAWPSYERCVQGAPPAREGGRPDISRADFTFCLLAQDWGFAVEETAARLMQESSKARENGEAYALRTAQNAAAALERRGRRQR